ncbi:ABC transporter ATP-binding protein [Thiomonas sp.]
MKNAAVISARGIGKTYRIYRNGLARIAELLTGRVLHDAFVALRDVSFTLGHGEVLGIIGRNGAGKSTLLKMLAGTLPPTRGELAVDGRIAALLELGSGFHPEMSGRENVYLYGAVLGLERAEIQAKMGEIIAFSGLEGFIDRPVKTYSSGMYVRLAFAVATSVDPDILIIDEALSVGDGAFARKSFDRIIGFKERGKTIVFCSHSMYQVEAICTRVIWVDHGAIVLDGPAKVVCAAYNTHLAGAAQQEPTETGIAPSRACAPTGDQLVPRILGITLRSQDSSGSSLALRSGESDLVVAVDFTLVAGVLPPSVIVAIVGPDGEAVCSALSHQDGAMLNCAAEDVHSARAELTFPALPLLRGQYTVDCYLMCERGLHCYEQALRAAQFTVDHRGLEQGVVALPHRWRITPLS